MLQKQIIKNLIGINKAVQIMYKKNGFHPIPKVPQNLKTDNDINLFFSQIQTSIIFPEYAHLKKNDIHIQEK